MPSRETVSVQHVFALPLLQEILLYAPLHSMAALIAPQAASLIRDGLCAGENAQTAQLGELVNTLLAGPSDVPQPRRGSLVPPFLGLIPTRSCNLACDYCGFVTSHDSNGVMALELARDVLDWHFDTLTHAGAAATEVHFFGGEPFCAPQVVDFAYHYARLRGAETGCAVRFEVATNGVFGAERCEWLADSFDSVILSLDGPSRIQDRNRRRKDGRGSYDDVVRSAHILSEGSAEFSIRVCVTADTVDRVPEIAAWLCEEFRPVYVAFEPVQPTTQSAAAGLLPPNPWTFARRSIEAARILEAKGVQHMYASADVAARRVSFCPVGSDVAIISPDGTVNACYLLRRDWEAQGLDLVLGKVENGSVALDASSVEAARRLNVWNKPVCRDCFCRWHCAGGCHVNHRLSDQPGAYDGLCIQTRIISLRNVLRLLGRDDLATDLLNDAEALRTTIMQPSDRVSRLGLSA